MLHPDIEDINDVSRYCLRCAFPAVVEPDGVCTSVFIPAGVTGTTVMGGRYPERTTIAMGLEEFLKIDIGVFKPRMVETKAGSLVYVYSGDTNTRAHGLNEYNVHYFWKDQPPLDQGVGVCGAELFNMHRTPWSTGREILEDGERCGIALSDRFGVITSDGCENPQIAWKTRIIGEVVGDRPVLESKWSNLYRVVDSLLSK